MNEESAKKLVREAYGRIAKEQTSCCPSPCSATDKASFSKQIGYSEQELALLPEGANLALGCGNPTALASLREGEVVLDLGSGAGVDCFIAAEKVGQAGKVIGVDMTPEMIEKARENAKKAGLANVEFRLGEIEHLPVADNSVDVVISNCVINLVPDKAQVFSEIFRVLKPGGRVAISDLALSQPLPESIRNDVFAYVGCIAGAITLEEYENVLKSAGFSNIKISANDYPNFIAEDTRDPLGRAILDALPKGTQLSDFVVSVDIFATKPG